MVDLLRHIGLCLIIYLDEMLFIHADREQFEATTPLIVSLFKALVNKSNSLLTPPALTTSSRPSN